jgi:hypothetical protein
MLVSFRMRIPCALPSPPEPKEVSIQGTQEWRTTETGLNRNRIMAILTTIVLVLVVLVVVAALGFWRFTYVNPPTTNPTRINSISLRDVGLCARICIYPSPELSATILVNASVPLSTLHLYINGTDEGTTRTANTMTNYALLFKATPSNPAMPIVDGKTYAITVVATFQDNSTCAASATVVASSGSGITSADT